MEWGWKLGVREGVQIILKLFGYHLVKDAPPSAAVRVCFEMLTEQKLKALFPQPQ